MCMDSGRDCNHFPVTLVSAVVQPRPRTSAGPVLSPTQELKLFSVASRRPEWSVAFWVSLVTAAREGANPVISGFPKPLPTGWSKRVAAATSFYAAFRPLFRQVGRWCTGIPSGQRLLRHGADRLSLNPPQCEEQCERLDGAPNLTRFLCRSTVSPTFFRR